jgi:hypothetical protein
LRYFLQIWACPEKRFKKKKRSKKNWLLMWYVLKTWACLEKRLKKKN